MEDVTINFLEKPKLKKPVLIEGLPGIGLVGKLAADHIVDELKAKRFAVLTSPYLPPQVVILDDGTVELVKMEFYYHKAKKNDLIILLGDFQGITPDSQYQIAEKTLQLAKQEKVSRIFTLGGLGTGNITQKPRVFGAATSRKLVEEYTKHGVIFKGGGAIFGASGLLLGLSGEYGIDAVCLMGETHGQIIDAKAAEAVLEVLVEILDLKVDMAALVKKASETEDQMSRISQMIAAHKKVEEQHDKFMSESPTYIR